MKFTTGKQVRFHHCDPASIVFYPQFFYLLHEVQEDFLAHIGFPEHELIEAGHGLPIVDMKTKFLGMCRYGDQLRISLELTRIGHTSIWMAYEIYGRPFRISHGESDSIKLRAHGVVVYSDLTQGMAIAIPDKLRSALLPFLKSQSQTNT